MTWQTFPVRALADGLHERLPDMPRAYPAEFRARAIALVLAGKEQKQTAVDLGIHPVTLSKWLRQDDIDNGSALAGSRRSPQSCVQRGDESASWKPSSRSSARPPSSSARTSQAPKGSTR